MSKIVYNACYGGFGLSEKAINRYWEIKGAPVPDDFSAYDLEGDRSDPVLVQVVEELGEEVNSWASKLVIRELPAGTLYRIDEYDGFESVCTQDDYKWSVA